MKGKLSGALSQFLVVNVTRCNSSDPTCANDTVFAATEAMMGRFIFVIPFVNVNINPGNQDYKKFYFED